MPKTLILGAGLAGLSAAYHLQGDYEIFEREARIGGLCRSETVKGFTFDYAIHILYSSDPYAAPFIKRLLGRNFHSQGRESWIYSKKTYTRYPFQANTFGLPKEVIKECVLGLIKAKYQRKAKPRNFEEFILATFGSGIARHFMLPYNQKQWAIPPKRMNFDWIEGRVLQPSLEEVLEGALTEHKKGFGPNAEFWYPKKEGIAALPNSFLTKLKNISLNSEITEIDLKKKRIEVNSSKRIEFDNLISSFPLPGLIDLIKRAPASIKSAAQDLKYNIIHAVNLGIDRPIETEKHWVYFPEDEFLFHRLSYPFNFSKNNVPKGKGSITAEVSCSRYKKINLGKLRETVIRDLIKLEILSKRDKILASNLLTLEPAYIIYDRHHRQNVKKIHTYLRENSVYPCGRFGEWEYLNMDHSILSGRKVALELNG